MVNEEPGFITLADIPTEKLEQLVRETPLDDSLNDKYLDALLTELISREDTPPVDVGAAWRQFQEIIKERETSGEFDEDAEAERRARVTAVPNPRRNDRIERRRGGGIRRAVRAAATVAAVAVLMCTSVFTAFAVPRIRTVVARWTDDIFTFERDGEYTEPPAPHTPTPPKEYSGFYSDMLDALAGYGITEPLAPTWIPEGFEAKEFYVDDENAFSRASILLEKDEGTSIIVQIKLNPGDAEGVHEKDDREVAVYEKEYVTHYIMTNNARIKAVWANGEYECYISVSERVGKDTLIKMIDSIYDYER